jgi:hypothetical protein
MKFMNALSLASAVNDWLENSPQPRILHVFDRACNLVNECGEVLCIVTPQIGNGPFNLVIEEDFPFSNYLHEQSSISINGDQLYIGDLTIHTIGANLWSPRPDWEWLYTSKDNLLTQLTLLPNKNLKPLLPVSMLSTLTASIAVADIHSSLAAAQKLAGLGIGLTPSGDDFIMGALYAAWIIHPFDIATDMAKEIARAAAPLTTSLSAAWLKAAGMGEAGILWHEFFEALTGADTVRIQTTMDKILAVGETSGADALAGFIGTFISYMERDTKPCHS